jgi:peptidoglycan/xylan/chitin deacetylase (PgdA/CDA1 family)
VTKGGRTAVIASLAAAGVLIAVGVGLSFASTALRARTASAPFVEPTVKTSFSFVDPELPSESNIITRAPRPVHAVAITFDDGPTANTTRVVDVLNKYHARATFFWVGRRVKNNIPATAYAVRSGDEVGNHTLDHYFLTVGKGPYSAGSPDGIAREIARADDTIQKACGVRPYFLRPRGLVIDETGRRIAKEYGHPIVGWSVQNCDTIALGYSPAAIAHFTLHVVQPGRILLFHETNPKTVEALPALLEGLKKMGLDVVTVSELLKRTDYLPATPMANATPAKRFDTRPFLGKQVKRSATPTDAVAITLDDGPSANTAEVLDILQEHAACATFFFVGNRVPRYRHLLPVLIAAGDEIGDHTWDHQEIAGVTRAQVLREIDLTQAEIRAACGVSPIFVRPPSGHWDSVTMAAIEERGLVMALWSLHGQDTGPGTHAAKIASDVVTSAHGGDVILLHETNPETVKALPTIIDGLRRKGLRLSTLSDLLGG